MAHPPAGGSHLAQYLPAPPVRRFLLPLARFLRVESASGAVLLGCTVLALALANSPAAEWYHAFWHTPVRLELGPFALAGDFGHLVVNDLLMTVFFFVVGLEIKRELVAGELREARKAALPVVAAVGGMVAPAGVYLALTAGTPGERGWGIPMATDIAFVVGVLTLLGRRVPVGLKILLLSLAIADDIGAVLVIAVFYSSGLHPFMLLLAIGGLCLTAVLNELGARSVRVYAVVGVGVWVAVYQSGVHPTVAGVMLGLLTPAGTWVSRAALRLALTDAAAGLHDDGGHDEVGAEDLRLLAFAAREAVSPLDRLETQLHPWVGFVIMPLFALANAGVKVTPAALADPVAVAVALGLFLGKPVGILSASWVAVRLKLAELPAGVTWGMMAGGGALAGIGFTMSLFVAGLALGAEHLAAGKVGTLAGSVCGAVTGIAILVVILRRAPRE